MSIFTVCETMLNCGVVLEDEEAVCSMLLELEGVLLEDEGHAACGSWYHPYHFV